MGEKQRDDQFQRALEHAQAEERKCASYLKALGWRVLPTTNFSASGAPMLEADKHADSLVMPDLQAFRAGTGVWFEVKWKLRATATDKFKGRLVTGVDRRNYEHYCRVEQETKIAVAIIFMHHTEREVRVGTLYRLDQITSHESDRMGRGGMVFWHYDKIPRWMSLGELHDGIESHRLGHVVAPTPPPIEPHVLRRHGPRRVAVFSPAAAPHVASWDFTCLVCDATWIGTAADHRCAHREDYRRNYWLRRFRFAKPGASADEIATLVDAPIARSTLVELLGPSWSVDNDPGKKGHPQ